MDFPEYNNKINFFNERYEMFGRKRYDPIIFKIIKVDKEDLISIQLKNIVNQKNF